jgi:hypothetical protein
VWATGGMMGMGYPPAMMGMMPMADPSMMGMGQGMNQGMGQVSISSLPCTLYDCTHTNIATTTKNSNKKQKQKNDLPVTKIFYCCSLYTELMYFALVFCTFFILFFQKTGWRK